MPPNGNKTKKKRVLYVAFSRTKHHLTILSNDTQLKQACVCDFVQFSQYQGSAAQQSTIALYLTHKDVYLDKFLEYQEAIEPLRAGDILSVNHAQCFDKNGKAVVNFSSKFKDVLKTYQQKGYDIQKAAVNFVVFWTKKAQNKNAVLYCRLCICIKKTRA